MKKVITLKSKAQKSNIKEVVKSFALEYLSHAGEDFMIDQRRYEKHKPAIIRYKNEVLSKLHGQVVECSATLHTRGVGKRGNLNTVVCIQINGVLFDHLNIYDEFIDELGVKPGQLFKFQARVYGYHRAAAPAGYGIKPVDMPINRNRNEF